MFRRHCAFGFWVLLCGLVATEVCFSPAWAQKPAETQSAAQSAAPTSTAPATKNPSVGAPGQADQKAHADTTDGDDDWSVIYMGKIRVGSSRASSKTIERDGKKLIRSESQSMMLMKRFGQSLKMKLTMSSEETLDGELVGVEFRNENPPNSFSKTIGKVEADQLVLNIESAGKTTRKLVKWDKANKSPAYQDRLLRENPLKPGETREFKMFLPELNQVTTVKMKEMGEEEVTLLDKTTQKLKRVDISQSVLPGFVTKTWMNAAGETLKSSTPGFFGSDMATYRVSRDEALREIVGAELDIAVDTLIKIDPPLERAHKTKQVVYEIKISGGDPVKDLPSGETQQLKSTGPESAELTVTSIRPPTSATESKAAKEFVESNRYLQADDARVVKHADAAAEGTTGPWDTALKMEKYVQKQLTKKNFSTALATAAEVAESLEGDCTEHACLLAAMCRVKKIPSRVVVGLVYAERLQAFGGHMWTEVFINGHWIPLDATLGEGGIGAGHIKLSDTSFSDEGPNATSSFLPILKIVGNTTLKVKSASY